MLKHRQFKVTVGDHPLGDMKPRRINKQANPLVLDSINLTNKQDVYDNDETKIRDVKLNISNANNGNSASKSTVKSATKNQPEESKYKKTKEKK